MTIRCYIYILHFSIDHVPKRFLSLLSYCSHQRRTLGPIRRAVSPNETSFGYAADCASPIGRPPLLRTVLLGFRPTDRASPTSTANCASPRSTASCASRRPSARRPGFSTDDGELSFSKTDRELRFSSAIAGRTDRLRTGPLGSRVPVCLPVAGHRSGAATLPPPVARRRRGALVRAPPPRTATTTLTLTVTLYVRHATKEAQHYRLPGITATGNWRVD